MKDHFRLLWKPVAMITALVLLTIWIAACSTIDVTNKVEGWPVLQTTVHVIDQKLVRDHCQKYVHGFDIAFACAEWDFDANTCDIYLPIGHGEYMKEHELAHCDGYDHPGSTYMREDLEKWKLKNQRG